MERSALGIQMHTIRSAQELDVLLERNPFKPIAIFSKNKLKVPTKYNRFQMNVKDFASVTLKEVL